MKPASDDLTNIFNAYGQAKKRLLLLDYDGTLVPFTPLPKQAKPSEQALSIIKQLAADTSNSVVIISARDKNILDAWLGHLPVQFIAEHGAFEKRGSVWKGATNSNSVWKEKVGPIMRPYIQMTPGSLLEEKETALAYHYRNVADQEDAEDAANELFQKLQQLTEGLNLRVTHASKAVEIRLKGADKGNAALASLSYKNYDFGMCAGDSDTDEDMFIKLANQAFCVKVGPGKTAAAYRVKSPEELIKFLTSLVKSHA